MRENFIDLFCGIGGFRVALEKKGLKCVFSSDIDEKVQETYEKNFGERPYGDIRKINEEEIPPHDILCAGFPCQSFSIVGNKKGFEDNRGNLFFEIVRIAEYHRPSILLLENVPHILSIDNGKVIRCIEEEIRKLGYSFTHSLLNASYFGIPQARKRVYFVCIRKDLSIRYKEPEETRENVYLEDILEPSVDENLYTNPDKVVLSDKKHSYQLKPLKAGYVTSDCQRLKIYSATGHFITLLTGWTSGYCLVNGRVRRLSVIELKRLMTFPDDHFVSKGLYGKNQLGNSVMPQMISKIYDRFS